MNCEHSDLQVPNVSSSSNSDGLLQSFGLEKSKSGLKISDRVKRKSWYNVIYPSYKTRAETFKKLFKDVPEDQRLIVGSCSFHHPNFFLIIEIKLIAYFLVSPSRLFVRFTA